MPTAFARHLDAHFRHHPPGLASYMHADHEYRGGFPTFAVVIIDAWHRSPLSLCSFGLISHASQICISLYLLCQTLHQPPAYLSDCRLPLLESVQPKRPDTSQRAAIPLLENHPR